MQNPQYKITEEQQRAELTSRIPPIVNVNILVQKEGKLLLGKKYEKDIPYWLTPGGRMKWTETPEETAMRILKTETPGLTASVKKLISVVSDKGWDYRAHGVTIYYLCDYISGEPRPNEQLQEFTWMSREEFISNQNIYNLDQYLAKEIDVAIRGMNISEDEILVEVDKNDIALGSLTKKEAHRSPERFHRSAHLMVFTSKGDVVLQQRNHNKMTFPGKWDMAGGHQVLGQSIEQCAASELAEELGITIPLQFIRKGLYQDEFQSEFYYLYAGISDGPFGFDKNEVAQVKVFNCKQLLNKGYPEATEVLPHVYAYLDELRSFWEPLTLSDTIP